MKQLYKLYNILLVFVFLVIAPSIAQAQTPGLIYKPATAGGNGVLDPNGDGYVSLTASGFSGTTDEGVAASEIPFRQFPALVTEPVGDLRDGSTGGHTDLVPPATPLTAPSTGSPVSAYFDGTNVLFRVRLGTSSTSSKGYSVLIDTDQVFNGTGTNPGFEYEVLLVSNFEVQVINHGASGSPAIFRGSVDQYSQKSIAMSTADGNADYFYDFYVPLSAFDGGITASSPLRLSGVTVTSAQSGLTGTVSDIGGVNFQAYGFDKNAAWEGIISSFPATSLNDLNASGFVTPCPTITGPLYAGGTTVSGTTTVATGPVVINVYAGEILIGTTTVSNTTAWTVALDENTTLTAGSIVTASAIADERPESGRNCNATTVSAECNRQPTPTLTIGTDRTDAVVTTADNMIYPNVTFNLYQVSSNATGEITSTLYQSVTATNTNTAALAPVSDSKIPDGQFYATITVDGCESGFSNYSCNLEAGTPTPVITTDPITPTTTQISGTAMTGASVTLFADNVQVGGPVIANSSGVYAFELQQALTLGQQVYVRAFVPGQCSSVSTILTVTDETSAPTITGTYCGLTSMISGTSTEPTGTTIQLYADGTELATSNTPTVNQNGYWSATLSQEAPAGTTITARATAPNKKQSVASEPATIAQQTSNVDLSIDPIEEGQTTITGSALAGTQVKLYIDGTPFTPVNVNSGGTWTVSGISSLEVFAGASITATATAPDLCESAKATPVTVTCQQPSNLPVVSPAALSVCSGQTATVTISSSEAGISYQLLDGTSETGAAVLGTGQTITLTSAPLNTGTVLTVRASKISGTTCDRILTGTVDVTIKPLPENNNTVTVTNSPSCAGGSATITIGNTVDGYNYQLQNDATGALVGTAQRGDGATLNFNVSSVPKTTTYSFRITDTDQNINCATTSAEKATVTIDGPDITLPVTVSPVRICPGGSVSINVATQSGYTYQLTDKSGAPVGEAFAGTGGVVTRPVVGISTSTSYGVQVISGTGISTACQPLYQQQATVEVTNAPLAVSAGESRTVCGTSVTLEGSNPAPGTGMWTLDATSTNKDGTIESPNNPNTVVSGLTSGTYVFTWTVTSACGETPDTQTANVTIIVNCPASYSINPPKYLDEYTAGDVLAEAFDPDGGIGSAGFFSGNNPPGVSVLSDGNMVVSNVSALVPGEFMFTVRTLDQKGVEALSSITLRIYGESPAIVPLPVELVYFTATVQNGTVNLQWLTASEKDNKAFVVERSADGKAFEGIGTVQGNGNSSVPVRYSFADKTPVAGTAYYRLKQVDLSGEFAYSNVIAVSAEGLAADMQLQAYPNPFQDELNITVTAPNNGSASLKLFDVQGRLVHAGNVELQTGLNEYTLPLRAVRKGMYILRLTGNGINGTFKVLKN